MKKIKILYIGLSANLGGIETYLYNLYKNIDKTKFEISFLVFKGKKVCFYDELKSAGVKIFEITHRNDNYLQFLKDLKNVYSNNDFDYIHQNLMDFSCFERITYANKYSKAKIIIHSHNAGFGKNVGFKTRILHKIGRFKIRNIKYLKVACGEAAGKWMFNNKKFDIFDNGIELEKFAFNQIYRNEIRQELKVDKDTILIGLVAKLEQQKNPLFLIDIFNEYQKLNNNSKLVIVGEGSLKEKIIDRINHYKINDKVILLGKRNDVNKIYSAYDIFLMPSLYEGLSISLIEAQANGLKCYTSNTVDKNSNITGNVEFLSLSDNKYWANYIFNSDNKRDIDALNKISDKFDVKRSCNKVYDYYFKNKVGELV